MRKRLLPYFFVALLSVCCLGQVACSNHAHVSARGDVTVGGGVTKTF